MALAPVPEADSVCLVFPGCGKMIRGNEFGDFSQKIPEREQGVTKFDTEFLKNLMMLIPPKVEREKIVSICEAISYKIETNNQINDNLAA